MAWPGCAHSAGPRRDVLFVGARRRPRAIIVTEPARTTANDQTQPEHTGRHSAVFVPPSPGGLCARGPSVVGRLARLVVAFGQSPADHPTDRPADAEPRSEDTEGRAARETRGEGERTGRVRACRMHVADDDLCAARAQHHCHQRAARCGCTTTATSIDDTTPPTIPTWVALVDSTTGGCATHAAHRWTNVANADPIDRRPSHATAHATMVTRTRMRSTFYRVTSSRPPSDTVAFARSPRACKGARCLVSLLPAGATSVGRPHRWSHAAWPSPRSLLVDHRTT